MSVRELMAILATCDPEMLIATAATNSIHFGRDGVRVSLLHTYNGKRVLIGDQSKNNLNRPSWYIEHALDGQPELKDEWPVPGEGHWGFMGESR